MNEYIDIDQLPPKRIPSKWQPIFNNIPIGKALVLPCDKNKAPIQTLRAYHLKNKYLNLSSRQTGDKIYIINNGEPQK